jgi:hypothetical protein
MRFLKRSAAGELEKTMKAIAERVNCGRRKWRGSNRAATDVARWGPPGAWNPKPLKASIHGNNIR